MDELEITEAYVIYVLSHPELEEQYKEDEKRICKKIQWHMEHMDEFEKELQAASCLRSPDTTKIQTSRTNKVADSLLAIMESSEKQKEEYMLALWEQYESLITKVEKIQRIHLALDTLDPTAKQILVGLYEKQEKWETMENELMMNHRTFTNCRSYAIRLLMERACKHTVRELGQLKNNDTILNLKGIKRKRTKSDEINGQLSLQLK